MRLPLLLYSQLALTPMFLLQDVPVSLVTAVATPLMTAIAALFGLYTVFLRGRIQSLEKQVGELEAENRSYLPLVVLVAAGNEESMAKLRRQAAALLERQSGVDLGE